MTTLDGRRLRSERTRERVVDAFLHLAASTGGAPSSQAIADQAGVTQRTLFNQFPDMVALLGAAVDRQVDHVIDILPSPAPGGSQTMRIRTYARDLGRVMDEIAVVRAVVVEHVDRPELREGLQRIRTAVRTRLADLLGTPDGDVIDAAEVATDPMTWRLLRRQQGHTRAGATGVVARMLLALVDQTTRASAKPS